MTDILAELLPRTVPDTLYHYTTQAGVIGILDGGEIWATDTQFLNDRSEYVHAVEVVRAEIAARVPTTDKEEQAISQMQSALKGNVHTVNICVCSFSENGDLLSQWRAYGESMSGFAIGFTGQFLAQCASRESFFLAPCLYEQSEQKDLVRRFIDKILGEILAYGDVSKDDPDHYIKTHGGNLITYLHRIAPTIKHPAFQAEQEWRVISRPLGSSRTQLRAVS